MAARTASTSRRGVYAIAAIVLVVGASVLGAGFANIVPGFHLGPSGTSVPRVASYPVDFSESGLPAGTTWTVVLGDTTSSSSSGALAFSEPAGRYAFTAEAPQGFTAAPSGGTVDVSAGPIAVPLRFVAVPPPPTYLVQFQETGLPASASWSVAANGSMLQGTSAKLAVSLPNGTYLYAVGPTAGYSAAPARGTVSVAGAPAAVQVEFSPMAPATFGLTFNQTGLPVGTSWSVTVNGSLQSTRGDSLQFEEPNGSYSYTVAGVTGYTAEPSGGTMTIRGAPAFVSVAFHLFGSSPPNGTYGVVFNETGVPASAGWTIALVNGTAYCNQGGEGTQQAIDLPNGTYQWYVYTWYTTGSYANSTGYAASPATGNLTVAGASLVIGIHFAPWHWPPKNATTYPVNFSETGLPKGVTWNVFTSYGATYGTAGHTITVQLPNGSWDYSGAAPNGSGYQATNPGGGSVNVGGGAPNQTIQFAKLTNVVVNLSGIGNSPVEIELFQNGTGVQGWGDSGGSQLTGQVLNGTYTWTALATLDRLAPSNGTFTASGATVWIPINATSEPTYTVTLHVGGLPSGGTYTAQIGTWEETAFGLDLTSYTSGPSATFALPNGSYVWSVMANSAPDVGFPASGSVTVAGGGAIAWTNFSAGPPNESLVVFQETIPGYSVVPSLPSGSVWSVIVNGTTYSTTGNVLDVFLPNGTYSYAMQLPAPYRAYPSGGSFNVFASPPSPFLSPNVYIEVDFGLGPFAPHPGAHSAAFLDGPAIFLRRV